MNPLSGSDLPFSPAPEPDLDSALADFIAAFEVLKSRIMNASKGRLGVSDTGLTGSTEANIIAMLTVRSSLDALTAIAGTRANDAGQIWEGFRPLLRTHGKASAAELNTLLRSARYASVYPVLGELWVDGEISRSQVRRIGDLALKVPDDQRDQPCRYWPITPLVSLTPNSQMPHASF